ncbi:MAG: DUF350 domain-containing protein [Raineya sp.]|nr:DUF350 domain-containing protein [Raineya sp.]
MNSSLFLAILHLIMTLLLAVLVTFGTTRLFIRAIRRKYQITPQNTAFAILLASVIFAVGYILSGLVEPIFKMVSMVKMIEKSSTDVFFSVLKYSIIFIVLGFVLSFVVVLMGMYLFNLVNTEINELQEISENNVAVGILVGVIIVVITLFVRGAIIFLVENLIPYPELPIRT